MKKVGIRWDREGKEGKHKHGGGGGGGGGKKNKQGRREKQTDREREEERERKKGGIFPPFRQSKLDGLRRKVDPRIASYTWVPKSWSFLKLWEVGNFPT